MASLLDMAPKTGEKNSFEWECFGKRSHSKKLSVDLFAMFLAFFASNAKSGDRPRF